MTPVPVVYHKQFLSLMHNLDLLVELLAMPDDTRSFCKVKNISYYYFQETMSAERDIAQNGPLSLHPIPYPDMNHIQMNGIGKPSYGKLRIENLLPYKGKIANVCFLVKMGCFDERDSLSFD